MITDHCLRPRSELGSFCDMGTRGYVVYRYRNIYFAFHHQCYSYQSRLGLKVLLSMRQPHAITILKQQLVKTQNELSDILYPEESFQNGVDTRVVLLEGVMVLRQPDAITVLKRRLVEILDDFKDVVCLALPFNSCNDYISWTRPTYGVFDAEWIYEIDLDRNIFHINNIPYFRLDCLPDKDGFLNYAADSMDHYGNEACAPSCPPCHKYERPAPPDVADSELAMYQSLVCAGSHVTLNELLVVNDILSPIEQVRVSLLEMMIGKCMKGDVARIIHQIELAPNHNQLTDDEWSIACSMANIAFIPQIFDKEENIINSPHRNRAEFTWVREDTVLCIATHLEDERCLQAFISRLINAISKQKNTPGDYFGVAFSVHHCAVVKLVKGEHATTFSHTDTLQFLPSFFGDSPSTPGIVALARLAYRIDPALFIRTLRSCNRQKQTLRLWSAYNKASLAPEANETTPSPALPAELWREIALHLHIDDILTLGLVSRLCRGAASGILHYPHVCGFRLVAVPKERVHCRQVYYQFLAASIFSAVQAGVPAAVVFGLKWTKPLVFNWKGMRMEQEGREHSGVYILLEVARKDRYTLSIYMPFSAERMVSADGKCLCGNRKHHERS